MADEGRPPAVAGPPATWAQPGGAQADVESGPWAPGSVSWAPPRDAAGEWPQPEYPPQGGDRRVRVHPGWLVGVGLGLLLVGLVLGGVIALLSGAAASISSPGFMVLTYGPGGQLESFELSEGACAEGALEDGASFPPASAVSCEGPHDLEVYASAPLPDSGAVARLDPEARDAFADAFCYLAFEPAFGEPWEASSLDYWPILPSAEAYDDGERTLSCAAVSWADETEDDETLGAAAAGTRA